MRNVFFFLPKAKNVLIIPFQSVTNWHVGPVLYCALAVFIFLHKS